MNDDDRYFVSCKGLRCGQNIYLPSSQIPFQEFRSDERGDEHFPEEEWPDDQWTAYIACPHCNTISNYEAVDVKVGWSFGEPIAPDSYVHVKTECGRTDCGVAVEFYIVDLDEYALNHSRFAPVGLKASLGREWLDKADWVEKVRSGFFNGGCVKGHAFLPIPRNRYKAEKHFGELPSLHEVVYWTRERKRA